jgi:hypothetical protein
MVMKKIWYLSIVFTVFLFACNKDELKTIRENLKGIWYETQPCLSNGAICDTLTFTSDSVLFKFRSEKYLYKIIHRDSIEIHRNNNFKTKHKITFSNNHAQLKIERFLVPVVGVLYEDIELIKN